MAADSLDGSLIGGEWTSNARGSLIDEFAVLVDPFSGPEYFYLVTEAGLDGYSIDLSGDRVRFDFFFEEWVGGFIGTPSSWVFTDIDDTVATVSSMSVKTHDEGVPMKPPTHSSKKKSNRTRSPERSIEYPSRPASVTR